MLNHHSSLRPIILIAIWAFINQPALTQELSIKPNNPEAIYNADANAIFTVTLPSHGKLEYILSNDGAQVVKTGSIDCKEKTVDIKSSLGKPGFLYCELKFVPYDGNESKNAVAAAAFEPAKIKPASERIPSDFDEFWLKKKQELAQIPMEPVLTPEPGPETGLAIYDVNVACIGAPVRGYYAKPLGAKKGTCPAIVFFQGAGVWSAGKSGGIVDFGKEGFIAFEINAHGVPNGKSNEYYANLASTTLNNYPYRGTGDRESCYFTGMFLRVARALQFIKSQPEWDGKHLVAYGQSQGGAQSIAAAGLDSDVTFMVAGVPAMCDHGGVINGWPRLVPVNKDGSYDAQVLSASQYIDCVNFARKAQAKALITVGFLDRTCRPTSVYAMYNSYAGPKQIINAPSIEHEWPPCHQKIAREQILAHVGKK